MQPDDLQMDSVTPRKRPSQVPLLSQEREAGATGEPAVDDTDTPPYGTSHRPLTFQKKPCGTVYFLYFCDFQREILQDSFLTLC